MGAISTDPFRIFRIVIIVLWRRRQNSQRGDPFGGGPICSEEFYPLNIQGKPTFDYSVFMPVTSGVGSASNGEKNE